MRMLRIIAILVFALLFGFSAHSLRKMQETGQLFERYNSQRKSSITLFGTSMIALLFLSAFEVGRLKKESAVRRYGERRYTDDPADDEPPKTACIYSSRKSVDEWPARRVSGVRTRNRRPARNLAETWLVMLRVVCLLIPCVNVVLFSMLYVNSTGTPDEQWIIPTMSSVFVMVAVVAAIGIFTRKGWGLSLGYLTAIINLILFPIGTAMGLFLLISLVGASPAFSRTRERYSRQQVRGMV